MPASARTNRRTKRLVRDVHCQLLDRVLVNIVNIVYFTLFGVRYCPLMTSTVSLSPFLETSTEHLVLVTVPLHYKPLSGIVLHTGQEQYLCTLSCEYTIQPRLLFHTAMCDFSYLSRY